MMLIGEILVLLGKGWRGTARENPLPPDDSQLPCRVQLLRALRELSRGGVAIAFKRPDDWSEQLEDPIRRERWFRELRNPARWIQWDEQTYFEYVPGTLYPCVVGKLLVKQGWCEPFESHWMPSAMKFRISESGKAALRCGREWWNSLSVREKASLIVME